METLNAILLALGSSVITAIVTWLLSRRQYKAQAQVTEAQAIKEEISNYKTIVNDMKEEVVFWHKQAEDYRQRFSDALASISTLELKIMALEKELRITKAKIDKIEQKSNG